jgi:light-harvesting complex 1 beta chain
MAEKSLSGLTDQEAQEFHSIFAASFAGFTVVAIIAHVLAWAWRPWLSTKAVALLDGTNVALTNVAQYLS